MTPELTHSILMQYQTPLADQADLAAIRKRVTDLAEIYDRYPGLYFKLMAINSTSSASVNEYTSIYLWRDAQSMARFLSGDNFHSYINAFARPPVRWWLPQSVTGDIESLSKAQFALRQIIGVPRTAKVGTFVSDWLGREKSEGALFQIVAIDPASWDLVTLSAWEHEPAPRWKADLFSLVHRSLPLCKY
jgi:hypothetical protein